MAADPLAIDFPPFRLDLVAGQLYRNGQPIALRPKTFATLRFLAERPGALVSKELLLDAVWPDVTVTDDAPRFTIRELRRVLGDDPSNPRVIATVHGRGYRFIGRPPADPPAVTASAAPITMVGRDAELTTLERWLAVAASGERVIGFVAGDAGMGKTTLIDAFLARVPRLLPGARVARGDCREAVGSVEPYQALLEAIHGLADGSDRDTVVRSLRTHAPTWLAQLPSLLDATERAMLRQDLLGSTSGRMAREFAAWVGHLAAEVALVLVVDDLHWGDGATLDALVSLAHARGPARVLLLATYRPIDAVVAGHPLRNVRLDLGRRRLSRELSLSLLDRPAVDAYLTARFAAVPPRVVEFVHGRADGNPLFMAALTDHLVATGTLVTREGVWHAPDDPSLADVGIPDTLRGMIEQQIDALPPFPRSVLEVASVVGNEFSTQSVVAALGELDPEVAEDTCEDLARRTRLIRSLDDRSWPDGSAGARFAFAHVLYRDVLYDRIPGSRRARLHQLVGERLERGFAADLDVVAADLGGQFHRSGDRERAVPYFARAARVAQRRFADREAVTTFLQALALLAELPETLEHQLHEIALRQEMAQSISALSGERSAVMATSSARLRALADTVGESPGQVMALFSILPHELGEGHITVAGATAARILDLCERVAPALVGLGHLTVGITHCYAGEFRRARPHLEARLREGSPVDWPVATDPSLICLTHLPELTLLPLGHVREALAHVDHCLARGEELRHPYAQVMARAAIANTWALLRDSRGALALADQAQRICRAYDVPSFAHRVALLHAWMSVLEGQPAAPPEQLREWLAVYEATSLVGKSVGFLSAVAIAAADGRREEALGYVHEGLRFVEASGERMREAELLRWGGELTARADRRPWLERALDVAARQEARWFELRAAASLVRLDRGGARAAAARDRLASVVATFDDTDAWPDLREARALLARSGREAGPD